MSIVWDFGWKVRKTWRWYGWYSCIVVLVAYHADAVSADDDDENDDTFDEDDYDPPQSMMPEEKIHPKKDIVKIYSTYEGL